MEHGDLSISEYFHRIKVTADLLANIQVPVSEKNFVTYAINGLGEKYDHIPSIIRYRTPPPSLLEIRSMLLLEESVLNRKTPKQNFHRGTTSFPTELLAGNHSPRKNSGDSIRYI